MANFMDTDVNTAKSFVIFHKEEMAPPVVRVFPLKQFESERIYYKEFTTTVLGEYNEQYR